MRQPNPAGTPRRQRLAWFALALGFLLGALVVHLLEGGDHETQALAREVAAREALEARLVSTERERDSLRARAQLAERQQIGVPRLER